MRQLVTQPTRVTTAASSLLDIILASVFTQHTSTNVVKTGMSDHYCVQTVLKCVIQRWESNQNEVKFRDYQNFDINIFLQDLRSNKSITNIHFNNVDLLDKWNKFKEGFLNSSDKCAPL
jgi:hypothetical protein